MTSRQNIQYKGNKASYITGRNVSFHQKLAHWQLFIRLLDGVIKKTGTGLCEKLIKQMGKVLFTTGKSARHPALCKIPI